MTESIQSALMLLAVGMITVFTILGGVIMTGHVLIRVVNSFSKKPALAQIGNQIDAKPISNEKIAVISAAVDHLTDGRGSIEKIEKI